MEPPGPERKKQGKSGFGGTALKIGTQRVNLFGGSRKELDGYDKIVHEYELGIKGLFAMPLSLVRESRIIRDGADSAPDPEGMERRLLAALERQIEGEVRQSSFSSWESFFKAASLRSAADASLHSSR